MSFFTEPEKPEATDIASRIGAVIGDALVAVAYLIVIYPIALSLLR